MPFLTLENSSYAGEPVYLYEFRRGTLRDYLASADRDIIAGSIVFKSAAISSNGFTQKGEAVTDNCVLEMPDNTNLAAWFAYTAPSDTVYVVIRRFHYGDTESAVVWIGTVVSVDSATLGKVTVNCQPVAISLKRKGLRMTWQRGCQHALYDNNCRVDKTKYAQTTTVAVVGPATITLTDAPPATGWMAGGFMEFSVGVDTIERRLIDSWSGAEYQLYGNMDGFYVGQTVTVYPGCQRTSIWCDTAFGNILNYGGFQYMPSRTPYSGDPIF